MNQGIINGIPVINNLDAINQFAVNTNKFEAITQSLYDSAAYPTTGIQTLTFFQTAPGGGTSPITGNPKTNEDTNMPGNGFLPNLQAFVITSVELEVQPAFGTPGSLWPVGYQPANFGAQHLAASVNDEWIVRATGYLDIYIGTKHYLTEGPLYKFPASNDMELDAAVCDVTTASATGQTRLAYMKAVGPAYILAPNNLLLIPMQAFNVTLNWNTLQPIANVARIFTRLMGQLIRSAQ